MIQTFPKEISDTIDNAWDAMQLNTWKKRVRLCLKSDPGALPEIQKVARKNVEKSVGPVKQFNEWILAGCPDEQ